MRKHLGLGASVIIFTAAFAGAVNAAPLNKTLSACRSSPGCSYSILKGGGYLGCLVKGRGGNEKCFYCKPKTKTCFQVTQIEPGKWQRVRGNPARQLRRP